MQCCGIMCSFVGNVIICATSKTMLHLANKGVSEETATRQSKWDTKVLFNLHNEPRDEL